MSARLTIAIPFHRDLDYLRVAVESVRAQSEGDWRLLVCDDGGRDQGVEELLAGWADARIRYQRNPSTLGMSASWNACLDRAETDLVTLLHADDRLLPDYAGLVTTLAERFPEAVAVCCAARIIGARGEPVFSLADAVKRVFVPRGGDPLRLRGEPALRAVMAGNFIMCPTLCYRKSRLGARRFSQEWQQVQDLELVAGLLLDGETLVYSRRAAYAYRRHPAGATALQSESLLRFEEEFALFERVARRAAELGWERAARVSRRAWIVRLHLVYRSLRALARLEPRRAAATLRCLAARSRADLG